MFQGPDREDKLQGLWGFKALGDVGFEDLGLRA